MCVSVTRREFRTPGTAVEHNKQATPTINSNDRPPAHLTDHAQGTVERAAQEFRRITPAGTATVHASQHMITYAQQGHHRML